MKTMTVISGCGLPVTNTPLWCGSIPRNKLGAVKRGKTKVQFLGAVITLLILLFAPPAFADNSISGMITGGVGEIPEPIEIQIILVRCGKELKLFTAWAGSDRKYFIDGLPPGIYIVKPMSNKYEFEPEIRIVQFK